MERDEYSAFLGKELYVFHPIEEYEFVALCEKFEGKLEIVYESEEEEKYCLVFTEDGLMDRNKKVAMFRNYDKKVYISNKWNNIECTAGYRVTPPAACWGMLCIAKFKPKGGEVNEDDRTSGSSKEEPLEHPAQPVLDRVGRADDEGQ